MKSISFNFCIRHKILFFAQAIEIYENTSPKLKTEQLICEEITLTNKIYLSFNFYFYVLVCFELTE